MMLIIDSAVTKSKQIRVTKVTEEKDVLAKDAVFNGPKGG
jgi:hypothetical protein